jgi:suppressor for copper-sensitivity B
MRLLSLLALFLLLSGAAMAAEREKHAEARLFSPVTATGDLKTVPLALEIRLQDGWDTYWRTPGDAGLPPQLDWAGSENLDAAEMKWPAPHRLSAFGIDNLVYTEQVIFPLEAAVKTPGAPLDLKLRLDLLVCNEICVPETHDLSLSLPAGDAAPSADAALHRAALDRLPLPAREGFSFGKAYLHYDASNRNYLVVEAQSSAPPDDKTDLFAEHPAALTFGKPLVTYDAQAGKLTLSAEINSNEPLEALRKDLGEGQVTLTYVDGRGAVEGSLPLSAAPDAAPITTPRETPVTVRMEAVSLRVLLFALLGGLILNLMPCVLPVLSLKVLSVASHGGKENRHKIFRNFMASSAGILVSFWLLAGGLAALKAAGESVGWGIQFQHPWFLVFLTVIVLLFAANMWGLFEIPLPRFLAKHIAARHEHEPTLAGHFLTGVFATLLATPCSAPFLGTAVGFALARGTFEIFMIFTFLGLGLALPYILLAVSPGLFRFMPKPGKWMVTLKKLLALALLVTAAWLASVVVTVGTMPALDEGWQAFDAAAIAPAVSDGKTVVVDVTADWCLTCKANKRFVLEQEDILAALSGENILRMQADWTQRDEAIAAYLRRYGRYGIPFNIVHGPGAPDGIVLPELLTKKAVLDALAEAAGE